MIISFGVLSGKCLRSMPHVESCIWRWTTANISLRHQTEGATRADVNGPLGRVFFLAARCKVSGEADDDAESSTRVVEGRRLGCKDSMEGHALLAGSVICYERFSWTVPHVHQWERSRS